MARPLRIEFAGAIYHVMARGNARQRIFQDDRDYGRLSGGLGETVCRYGWELFSYVLMPNHLHLFLRTPKPNLSRGMQYLLSGYANWFSKRHQRPGHLFQGRFRGDLIEHETHFWAVSRYNHLNPLRGRRPLAAHPREWPWSSYPGFADRRRRVEWVAYDVLLSAWQGEMGGSDPASAYRRFVEEGIQRPPENPFRDAAFGWLLGSEEFVERIREAMRLPKHRDEVPAACRLAGRRLDDVLVAVADHYRVTTADLRSRQSGLVARDVAAWLARRLTTATLRQLAEPLGLGHPDSVRNLTRRADRALRVSRELRADVEAIQASLKQTENRV